MTTDKVTIGPATLYLGDCADILPTLGRFDLLLTDPPYGIKRFEKGFGSTRFKGHGAEKNGIAWDKKPEFSLLLSMIDMASTAIIWGANNFSLPPTERFLIWDKMQTVENFASAEYAYYNGTKPAQVFRYSIHQHNQDEKIKAHPTQKPVPLMAWCIEQCKTNPQTIIDPFAGSGTTGVAAVQLGRQFVGIERERQYFDIACQRIEQAVAQGKLFSEPVPEPPKTEALFL